MHGLGFTWASLPTLSAGGTVITLTSHSFDPAELLAAVERHRVTTLAFVGDAYARPLLRQLDEGAAEGRPFDCSSLRRIASSGVAWTAEVKRGLRRHLPGVVFIESCGATEGATFGLSIDEDGDNFVTGQFQPTPGTLVLDEDGKEVGPGGVGLLAGLTFTSGYFNDPAKTAEVFKRIDGQPYVVPGDYARLNENGTITLLGRGSGIINTGGEKVYAEEVEAVIKSLEEVDDCLVLGVADDRFGQMVSAIVQLRPAATLDAAVLEAHVRAHLAGYKVPREVIMATVPRQANGKADYPGARVLVASRRTPTVAPPRVDELD
jgi:fatty-acyl-CoA synthase